MSRITVTGASLPPPETPGALVPAPPRLNIADLIKNDRQWSLYVQALSKCCT